jgi:hypothetical protein
MGKLKKIKKWATLTHRDVERAERAADRAEEAHRRIAALVGTEATVAEGVNQRGSSSDRAPFYTSPAGHDATPSAAAVSK